MYITIPHLIFAALGIFVLGQFFLVAVLALRFSSDMDLTREPERRNLPIFMRDAS